MTRRFTVKKEIRVLGIDLCNPECIVGAVVRGGLYLDGVVVLSRGPIPRSQFMAHEIVRTPFYPELKLIMTHDPRQELRNRKIEKTTSLPVLEISSKQEGKPRVGFHGFRIGAKNCFVRGALDARTVREILERTWTAGSLPESLRVAHLIARSRPLGKNRPF